MLLVLRFKFSEIRRKRLTDGTKELTTMAIISFGITLISIVPYIKHGWFSSGSWSIDNNNSRVATASSGAKSSQGSFGESGEGACMLTMFGGEGSKVGVAASPGAAFRTYETAAVAVIAFDDFNVGRLPNVKRIIIIIGRTCCGGAGGGGGGSDIH